MATDNSMQQRSTPPLSRILVAVDGSEESLNAADYAIGLLLSSSTVREKEEEDNNRELVVLTVTHIPSVFDISSPSALEQWKERDRIESKKWFDRIRKNAEQNKVKVREELIESSLAVEAVIVDYAEKENVDLIVVGTRGRSGFKRLLLGSVASGVVTYATKPVIIVK